jgi:thermitase
MKALVIIFIALAFIFTIPIIAQDFYYSDGRKIYIEKADNWITVQYFKEDLDGIHDDIHGNGTFVIRKELIPERGIFWLEIDKDSPIDIGILEDDVRVVRTFPAYYFIDSVGDTNYHIMSDIFHVRFAEDVSEEDVHQMNEKHFVEIVKKGLRNEYLLRITEGSQLTTLDAANLYYESEKTLWSLPDFLLRGKPDTIQDPLFSNQWYLQNTGQGGGVSGIDINAPQAWLLSELLTIRDSDIIVAVADQGVEMHEDFYHGQLVTGFNAEDQSNDGSPVKSNDSHGQPVAGIIAANHNDKGVRGIAPHVKIMSIRVEDATTSESAAAFDTAWSRGADVINISWGWGEGAYHDNIAQALENAMSDGRNGKGTVIVKSAGNTGGEVSFPGNVPGVLTVGAVSNLNQPAPLTPISQWVDIMAASHGGTLWITTTDRHPPYGYRSQQKYFDEFSGTSAAAPQASGVAALILSLYPELSEQEVRDAIMHSATSYGQTDWAGSGRLHAFRAIGRSMPIQYINYNFTSSVSLSEETYIFGNTSISSGTVITVPSGKLAVLDGTATGGTNAEIRAYGKLFVAQGANIKGVKIKIENGAQLIVTSGATIKDGKVTVESGGELIANGSTFDLNGQSGNAVSFKSGSSGSINQSRIRNATRGIDINNAAVSVKNSTIEYNSSGIWLTNTSLSEVVYSFSITARF